MVLIYLCSSRRIFGNLFQLICKTWNFWRNSTEFAQRLIKQFPPLRNFSKWSEHNSLWVWVSMEQHKNDMLWKSWSFSWKFFKIPKYDLKMLQLAWTYLCLSWKILGNVIIWRTQNFWQNSTELAQSCTKIFNISETNLCSLSIIYLHRITLGSFGTVSRRFVLFVQLLSKFCWIVSKILCFPEVYLTIWSSWESFLVFKRVLAR